MKPLGWTFAVLAILAVVLAISVARPPKRPPRDCVNQVLIVKGANGEPLECVCEGGTASSCFRPGP